MIQSEMLKDKSQDEIMNVIIEDFVNTYNKNEGDNLTEKEKDLFKIGMAYGLQAASFMLINYDPLKNPNF